MIKECYFQVLNVDSFRGCDVDSLKWPNLTDSYTVTLDCGLTRNQMFQFCEDHNVRIGYRFNAKLAYYIINFQTHSVEITQSLQAYPEVIPLKDFLQQKGIHSLSIF